MEEKREDQDQSEQDAAAVPEVDALQAEPSKTWSESAESEPLNLEASAEAPFADSPTIAAPIVDAQLIGPPDSEPVQLNWGTTLVFAIVVCVIGVVFGNLYGGGFGAIALGVLAIPYVFAVSWLISFIQPKTSISVFLMLIAWLVLATVFSLVIYFKSTAVAGGFGFLILGVISTPIFLGIWSLSIANKTPAHTAPVPSFQKFVELENMGANGGAVGSFVLGIWTVVGALITSWSFINGMLGLILGFWGLSSKRPWLAGIGIVLSAIGALMCLVDISAMVTEYFATPDELDF